MTFYNVNIFRGERGFLPGNLILRGNRFQKVITEEPGEIFPEEQDETEDLGGAFVLPGLVDLHTHGNSGFDFSDGDEEELRMMARYLALNGITSFLPTSMTLPYAELDAAYRSASRYLCSPDSAGARILGIHMEGPFFSERKKGAQNSHYLRIPDAEAVKQLNECSGGLLRIVDVAPELSGALEFIKELSVDPEQNLIVSVAHTDASYEETKAAFQAGAVHVTHMFNGMPELLHRTPGVVGAAAEAEDITVELICDGLHIHPAVVRIAFRLFRGQICMISDSLRCCGMPDGTYELGGQQFTLKAGEARLPDGTLAGAASNLFQNLRSTISFGVPVNEAIMAATITPAKAIGCDREIGSIEEGKFADFVVCDRNFNIRRVYLNGTRIR